MNFIPETSVLIAFLAGVFIMNITPGPDMTFFISRAIGQNTSAGIAAFAGAMFGISIHTIIASIGLAAIIFASPIFFLLLKIAGAIYLGFLAFQALKYGSSFQISDRKQRHRSFSQNFLQGLGINLLNPKIILFFMTFLPQFVSAIDPYAKHKMLFLGAMFIITSSFILIPLVLTAGKFSSWMQQNRKATRIIDYLFAGVFGSFAIKILLTERG